MSRLILLIVACLALVSLVAARQGSLDPVVTAHEGSPCSFQQWSGKCTSGPCVGGHKLVGKCKGPAHVQCCVMGEKGAAPAAPGVPAPGTPIPIPTPAPAVLPTGPVPYNSLPPVAPVAPVAPAAPVAPVAPAAPAVVPSKTPKRSFPYSQARHIVADFALQRIRLYDGAKLVKEWKISSGAKGIGFKPDYPASPSGKFKVVMKVGNKQPLGMIIEKLTPQGRIGKEGDKFAHMQTRILVLDGQDKENKNTRSRSIYIHGTNREIGLGKMASHGCFRMGNKAVIELFDAVQTGVEFFAIPSNAWPNDGQVSQATIPAALPAPAPATAVKA